MRDIKTEYLNLPLPDEQNMLEDDCPRIRQSFQKLDAHAKTAGAALAAHDNLLKSTSAAIASEIQNRKQADATQTEALEALLRNLTALTETVTALKNDPWKVFPLRVPIAVDGVTLQGRHPIMPGESEPRENWLVCDGGDDGQGGTVPDLRGRMILGAGDNHPAGSAGGSETQPLSLGFSGSVNETTLTEAQMPYHIHKYLHRQDRGSEAGYGETGAPAWWDTTGTGGSQWHTHGFSGTASGNVSTLSPYYALAFVMRVA